jgi:hypothetical protein
MRRASEFRTVFPALEAILLAYTYDTMGELGEFSRQASRGSPKLTLLLFINNFT